MHSLTLLITAAVVSVSARLFDRLTTVPHGWSKVSPALPTDRLALKIALRQKHGAALEQKVMAISSPGSPEYGAHLTRHQLRSYVAPAQESVTDVTHWLAEHGIVPVVDNDWITIATDVRTANLMLGADFGWYRYGQGGALKLRTLRYGVPDHVARHIDLIQPTTRFGQPVPKRSTIHDVVIPHDQSKQPKPAWASKPVADAVPDDCNTAVTPSCLRKLYNIAYKPEPEGNLVAFASYLEQYARHDDLDKFTTKFVPDAVHQNFSVVSVHDGLDDQKSKDDSFEANLDVQYLVAVSHPIPVVEYSVGGRGPLVPSLDNIYPVTNEPYLEFLTYLLAEDDAKLPQTLSTSYGEEEQTVPREYALKVCNLIMQLGARGVSVLFSSGDSGPGGSCKSNSDNKTTIFQPVFPAGCPYVTSVGGTQGVAPEHASSFSSGGFSIYHARPGYQVDAVSGFLDKIGEANKGFFNQSGRGFPDVAALSANFNIVDKGHNTLVSGTSASTPLFAGVVALLNAARRSQGSPPLGFLNPWLYNNTDILRDIVAGSSRGCSGAGGGLRSGGAKWDAIAGWDAATGLGVPIFDKMLAAAAPGVANE